APFQSRPALTRISPVSDGNASFAGLDYAVAPFDVRIVLRDRLDCPALPVRGPVSTLHEFRLEIPDVLLVVPDDPADRHKRSIKRQHQKRAKNEILIGNGVLEEGRTALLPLHPPIDVLGIQGVEQGVIPRCPLASIAALGGEWGVASRRRWPSLYVGSAIRHYLTCHANWCLWRHWLWLLRLLAVYRRRESSQKSQPMKIAHGLPHHNYL